VQDIPSFSAFLKVFEWTIEVTLLFILRQEVPSEMTEQKQASGKLA
jgi:hypothetical protein